MSSSQQQHQQKQNHHHNHNHNQNHNHHQPVIRKRSNLRSLRRKDGLMAHAYNVHSQNGEDGILQRLFELLTPPTNTTTITTQWCVDVGAWDGQHLSNTHELLLGNTATQSRWRGILIEADEDKFSQLQARYAHTDTICLPVMVSAQHPHDPQNLPAILQQVIHNDPQLLRQQQEQQEDHLELDFLCIDIDGDDYWVWHDVLVWSSTASTSSRFGRAKVVCIEFNPTMPDDLIYIPPRPNKEQVQQQRQGASLSALVELAKAHDYVLVETTLYNAFFVTQNLYDLYLQEQVPDTSIEALHDSSTTMTTQLYQLYDGTLKLWGCKKLLWHRIPLEESKLQVLSQDQRHFPFAPNTNNNHNSTNNRNNTAGSIPEEDLTPWMEQAIDLSAMRNKKTNDDDAMTTSSSCQQLLLRQLERDGFALVRGTGMDATICQAALDATQALLQDAPEDVRRSCLSSTDRARRGYAPMNVENFASLLGEAGKPNDLVRKFRVGKCGTGSSSSMLLQPNIWPSAEVWGEEACREFQEATERYYEAACQAANLVLQAICQGLLEKYPQLESSLAPLLEESLSSSASSSTSHHHDLSSDDATTDPSQPTQTTSILTLLGYRTGTRHKGKNKGPLVAAHTDVGVITMLLYDGGSHTCATLQRQSSSRRHEQHDDDDFVNVDLPTKIPNEDPIFCINVADCLSDLSGHRLPSTVHRVVANRSQASMKQPRNCCALFVGLDPKCPVLIPGENSAISYEEWRRQRVSKSQDILRGRSSLPIDQGGALAS